MSFREKTVGKRIDPEVDWDRIDQMLRMVTTLRRTASLVPRGVYRFRTFEEADQWMVEMTARTHAHQLSTTSSESATR